MICQRVVSSLRKKKEPRKVMLSRIASGMRSWLRLTNVETVSVSNLRRFRNARLKLKKNLLSLRNKYTSVTKRLRDCTTYTRVVQTWRPSQLSTLMRPTNAPLENLPTR